MRRVTRVISVLLRTGAGILVLAACAAAATSSAAKQARCAPQGARTLAADGAARLFSWHGSVYGCIYATGDRRTVGSAGFCLVAPGRAAPVALAGAIIAYGLERCGVDTGSSIVVVSDLATGRRLADPAAATLPLGPESYVSVESIVLRRDGAVGWIARAQSLVNQGPARYEVHRFEGSKASLLGSGTAIRPASLRLSGTRMSWTDRAVTRSATLS